MRTDIVGMSDSVNDTWLSCTASQVGHTYVSHAFFDSNRALATNYTANITNYKDFSQVLIVYSELGILGGLFARAGWLEQPASNQRKVIPRSLRPNST